MFSVKMHMQPLRFVKNCERLNKCDPSSVIHAVKSQSTVDATKHGAQWR